MNVGESDKETAEEKQETTEIGDNGDEMIETRRKEDNRQMMKVIEELRDRR